MSGTLSVGQIVVQNDSLVIDQLTDVDASAPIHNDVIVYKDTLIDPSYSPSGWYSAGLLIENFTNVNSVTAPVHNEILVYNENAQDGAYPDGWVNKNISAVFTGLNETITSIVSNTNAIVEGENGNTGKGEMVMFTDTVAGTGVVNVALGSAFDNNALFKRELTDDEFIFVQDLSQGEILNTTYPVATILKSTKGIYGFTGPVPTPLGIPGLSFKITRFSTNIASTTVVIASLGLEVTVTLFESDGTTVADGPTAIAANETQSFACNSTGEFVVSSTGAVIGYVNGNGDELRILMPMTTEMLVHDRNITISALSGSANAMFYRRTGVSGGVVITSGTPLNVAGGSASWASDGWVLLRSDVPLSAFTGNDSGTRSQSTPGWPISQLAQVFPNPSFLDNDTDHAVSSISIASPYEGTATVYDNTGTVFDTFTYTRTVPVTTAADQLYPAAGLWKPSDVLVSSTLDGGYVICNTPSVCVMNFSGSAVWTGQSGDEMIIAGTTPEDLRAEITLDANGIARRRDMDAVGVVTWNIC